MAELISKITKIFKLLDIIMLKISFWHQISYVMFIQPKRESKASFFIQTIRGSLSRKSEVEEGSGRRNGFQRRATEVKERDP